MRPTLIKITAAVAVGALLLAVCPTAAEPTPRRSGDLNDDGIVNSADQRLLLQATGGAADLDQNRRSGRRPAVAVVTGDADRRRTRGYHRTDTG